MILSEWQVTVTEWHFIIKKYLKWILVKQIFWPVFQMKMAWNCLSKQDYL